MYSWFHEQIIQWFHSYRPPQTPSSTQSTPTLLQKCTPILLVIHPHPPPPPHTHTHTNLPCSRSRHTPCPTALCSVSEQYLLSGFYPTPPLSFPAPPPTHTHMHTHTHTNTNTHTNLPCSRSRHTPCPTALCSTSEQYLLSGFYPTPPLSFPAPPPTHTHMHTHTHTNTNTHTNLPCSRSRHTPWPTLPGSTSQPFLQTAILPLPSPSLPTPPPPTHTHILTFLAPGVVTHRAPLP